MGLFDFDSDSASIPSLQDSIKELGRLVREPSDLDFSELPHLDSLIDDWYDDAVEVTQEDFARRALRVFKASTHHEVYNQVLESLPTDQKIAIDNFTRGHVSADAAGTDLASRPDSSFNAVANEPIPPPADAHAHSHSHSHSIRHAFDHLFHREETSPPAVAPAATLPAGTQSNLQFENWGRTVKNTPAMTYYPTNVEEIKTIVRQAVKDGRGIRASGFRHSWSPVFGRNNKPGQTNNGDVLISVLSNRNATVIPNFTALPTNLFQPPQSELNDIRFVDAAADIGGPLLGGKRYVRVGAATTNEQLRRWCINTGKVQLPMNIVQVEITLSGSNAMICHGAGINNATLSDIVRAIEFVDVKGEVRRVDMSDPDLLKAASGCFGLLGIVTHITLEFDAISTAVMKPVKMDVIDAIPPPPDMKDSDIPEPLRKPRTLQQKRAAQLDFERRANNDHYAEWFWFPYSSQCWVNTWGTDVSTENVVNYPSTAKTFLEVVGTVIVNMAQVIIQKIGALEKLPYLQTVFLSWLSMKNLDEVKGNDSIRTLVPNALHFQRGIQNMRVRDMEVEFALQPKKGTTTERDYTNMQRAWWDAIIVCYSKENLKRCPMRMPLEARVMAGSNVTMAPQRGHILGTCSIEVLTLHAASEIWTPYAQEILDKWTSYKDTQGNDLVIRPHWAKEWDNLTMNGKKWREVLKNEVYKDEIVEFKGLLAAIGEKHGFTLGDLKRTYSNELLDYLYLDDVVATPKKNIQGSKEVVLEKNVSVVVEKEVAELSL